MLMFILLLSSTKIDNGVKLAHLVVWALGIGLCVLAGSLLERLGVYWRPVFIRESRPGVY